MDLLRTKSAAAEFDLGVALHRQGRLEEAAQHYRHAVELDPEHVDAWIHLGIAEQAAGRLEEAMKCQREALRIDPNREDALSALGSLHYARGELAEALDCFREAHRLDPAAPHIMCNLAGVLHLDGQLDAAVALCERALANGGGAAAHINLAKMLEEANRLDEAEAHCRAAVAGGVSEVHLWEAHRTLSFCLRKAGRLVEGFAEIERCRCIAEAARPALPTPRWKGEPIEGKTILVFNDEGFGDALQFCRYVPMIAEAGGRVVLVASPPLYRLMRTLDGVDRLVDETTPLPPADYHCPLAGLPYAFRTSMDTIPAAVPYL